MPLPFFTLLQSNPCLVRRAFACYERAVSHLLLCCSCVRACGRACQHAGAAPRRIGARPCLRACVPASVCSPTRSSVRVIQVSLCARVRVCACSCATLILSPGSSSVLTGDKRMKAANELLHIRPHFDVCNRCSL
eukprot:6187076-Pleurochrysis_carterae.AAC.3